MRVALRALGFDASKDEVKIMSERIAHTGKDGRVCITFESFTDAVSDRMLARDPREEMAKAFALFDEEQRGKINIQTLKRIAKELGESMTDQELEEMIIEADQDNDGEVNLEDFIKMMQSTNIY